MKIDILGTEYSLRSMDTQNIQEFDGMCETYTKKIKIRFPEDMLEEQAPTEAKFARYNETLRHEIIHAFLFESGLENRCDDEEMVDWMAKQFPKIAKTFEETGCM